jgi:hypothetical protein
MIVWTCAACGASHVYVPKHGDSEEFLDWMRSKIRESGKQHAAGGCGEDALRIGQLLETGRGPK